MSLSLPATWSAGTTLLALAALVLPVALGLSLMRAVRRRQRGDERDRTRRLGARMRAHLRGRGSAPALAEAAASATEVEFWGALESRLPRLTRGERRRLGRLFERGRHLTSERRALLVESPLRRELAARRLGLLPGPRARRALRSAFASTPEVVAYAAARSLARDGDARTLDWLLGRSGLLPRRNARQWSALLRAFGRRALPRLAEAIAEGLEDVRVLRAGVETLGHQRHSAAAPAIERLLLHAEPDVRVAAAKALGRMAAEPCSNALLLALKDPEWAVRAQAAWALGRIGREEAVPSLAACLTDRAWWVRRHAAYALAALGRRGADVLRLAAHGSADRYARDIADEALRSLQHLA